MKIWNMVRINNNGNYEKSNCRWATQQEQVNNYSQNNIQTIDGITDTVANLCRLYKVNYGRVRCRLQH